MANSRVFIIADTETTGLDPEKGCEIVQIAAIACNPWDFSQHHAGKFSVILKPLRPDLAQPKAIQVLGPLWEKAQKEGVEPKVGLQQFNDFCAKCNEGGKGYTKPLLTGHNIPFDKKFLEYAARQHKVIGPDVEPAWDYHVLDTWSIMFTLFESNPSVFKYNLDSYLEQLGMSRKNQNHDAVEDVELTYKAFVRSMKFLRECSRRMKIITEPAKV